jgi:putative holliday junction resolvase
MRALGLDIGERRIGVAISDPTGTLARPLTIIVRGSRREDFVALAGLVVEHGAGLVVAGRPLSLDGSTGPQARRVERYVHALGAHVGAPVVFHDERYSTVAAHDILRETGKRGSRTPANHRHVDAVAAAVILQSYLDSQVEKGVRV